MKNLGKLPKLESNRSEKDFAILGILIGIVVLGLVTALILAGSSLMYNKAMRNCTENGYNKAYCEMMLH